MKTLNGIRHTLLLLPFLLLSLVTKAQTAFTCQDQVSYITKNTSTTATTLPYTLYSTNLITGAQTPLGAVRTSGGSNLRVNAIGYNTADNFIWGSQPGTSNILKIGANGVAQSFAVTGLPVDVYNAGDVDGAGNLYLYLASASTIYKINLTGPTYSATAIAVTGANLSDFSVSADGTKIYGISAGNGNLVVYTISGTSSTRTATDIGFSQASFNSFLDSRGNMFIQSQGSGDVYLLRPTDATVGTPKKVSAGSPMTNADGAQCRTASVYSNAQATFGCQQGQGFILQSAGAGTDCNETPDENLYTVNVQTNTFTEFYPNITSGLTYGILNNLGYNATDGYLWAYRYSSNQLARIGSDKTVQFFPIDGLPANCATAFGSGGFDQNGIFYLMNGLTPTEIHKVDLNPGSANYRKYLGSFPITIANGPLSAMTDIAVNPVDGLLYGISNSRNLIRINPSTGAATNLGATSIGGTTNFVTNFIDVTGTLYTQASGSTNVYRISDVQSFNGTANPTATLFRSDFPSSTNGDGAFCSTTLFAGVPVSGNVWDDGNGDRIKTESNTVTDNTSETLTVYLTDENGTIVGKSDVAADGTWSIGLVPPGAYNAFLSNNAALVTGTKNAVIASSLPDANWVHTGINFANTPGASGSSSGALTVAGTNITNLNFGLDAVPDSDNKSGILAVQPGQNSFVPLDGTITDAKVLTGKDPEDYATGGDLTGKRVAITSLPTNGELWYNGAKIAFGKDGTTPPSASNPYIIPGLTNAQLSIKFTGSGYTTTTFEYAYIDLAGVQDPTPATYTLSFERPLPVTIASFSAKKEGTTVRLLWSTTTESNSAYFAVEYSTTGKTWLEIGRRDALGSSFQLYDYNFIHTAPAAGQNLYRLKAVDADGTFAYSRAVNASLEIPPSVQVFPNPASNWLMLNTKTPLSQISRVQIITSKGKTLYTSEKLTSGSINLARFPNGTYLLNVQFADGNRLNKRFVIAR